MEKIQLEIFEIIFLVQGYETENEIAKSLISHMECASEHFFIQVSDAWVYGVPNFIYFAIDSLNLKVQKKYVQLTFGGIILFCITAHMLKMIIGSQRFGP